MKRAAIYSRVSTSGQLDGTSIDTQAQECRKYAATHNYTIIKEVSEDVSGTTLARPGLLSIREMVKARALDAVIVFDPDRLARNLGHLLLVMDECDKAGVSLEFVNAPNDNSPAAMLMLQVRGAVAQFEREKIVERTQNGRRARALSGRIVGNWIIPYGYDYHEGMYTINPDEAQVVLNIFEWLSGGDHTLYSVAMRLHDMGIPTKRGSQWMQTTIKQLINNTVYKGEAVFNRRHKGKERPRQEWITVPVPAIVTPSQWDATNRAVQDNKHIKGGNRQHPYLLAGFLICGHCRRHYRGLTDRRPGRVAYYRCAMRERYEYRYEELRCPMPTVRLEPYERLVWRALIDHLLSDAPLRVHDGTGTTQAHREVSLLTQALEGIEREKADILEAYRHRILSMDDLRSQMDIIKANQTRLETELATTQERIARSMPQSVDTVEKIRELIKAHREDRTPSQKRAIMRQLMVRVEVNTDHLALYCLPNVYQAIARIGFA